MDSQNAARYGNADFSKEAVELQSGWNSFLKRDVSEAIERMYDSSSLACSVRSGPDAATSWLKKDGC